MEITETQELLMNGLLLFGIDVDMIPPLILLLKKEEEAKKMIFWMVNHPQATIPEILKQVSEISTEGEHLDQ